MSRNSRVFTTLMKKKISVKKIYMSRNSRVFTTRGRQFASSNKIYMSRNSRVFTTLRNNNTNGILDLHE